MVLLRHTVPDGSWHLDWLVRWRACDVRDAARPLLAVRLMARPDGLGVGRSMPGELAPDHRSIYLEFEGELAPGVSAPGERVGRGRVERVAWGSGEARRGPGGLVRVEGRFDDAPQIDPDAGAGLGAESVRGAAGRGAGWAVGWAAGWAWSIDASGRVVRLA